MIEILKVEISGIDRCMIQKPGTVLNDFFWLKLHFLFIALPWLIMASYEKFYFVK